MIRLLTGLNQPDALHELNCLGIQSPSPELTGRLRENFALKISGFPREELDRVRRFLESLEEISIISPAENQPENAFILYLPHSAKAKFQQRFDKELPAGLIAFREEMRGFFANISRSEWHYTLHDRSLIIVRPLIMGILNVTPDSFSDGGKFFSAETAQRHAEEMLEAGADIIDVGGESTRPGSEPVAPEEEWRRIAPIIQYLAKLKNCIISVDTCKSEIARRALSEGAHIINDISAMAFDPRMAETAALNNTPVALMHMQGTPKTMQKNPSYQNMAEEILLALDQSCRSAVERGVKQLIVDPGIGFGKRLEDNYELLRRLGELRSLGYPILLGTSRKSFIGNLLKVPPEKRLPGTIAASLYGIMQGAAILRVHDVAEVKQSLLVYQAIQSRKSA